ncbi:hypothetical protein [Acidipila sp. EB88]|uniref:hypothetical protein n=1 Tax=Acidipila sp. EB88 TaxID=2305226 RepID=UPI000F5E8CBA|nr:hypothetical protein [Acidipila sp. EB88]
MARTVSWRHRAGEIAERVRHSVTESWTRRDLERVFAVQRVTAQSLMRAIGEVQNIGGTYLVSRAALLRYLEAVDSADDLTAAHRERLLFAEPVPRPRSLKVDLPEDLHAVMLRDLPPEIQIEPGRIEIRGADPASLLQNLYLLVLALEQDLGSIEASLEAPPVPRQVPEVDEMQEMFERLRLDERSRRLDSCV